MPIASASDSSSLSDQQGTEQSLSSSDKPMDFGGNGGICLGKTDGN
jgi:hypothetical protein